MLILRFDPNPRVAGISGAFTALSDDENALFYNPAGLINLKSGITSLNHTEWFEDIRIDNISFGYQINDQFGIGAGFSHMWMPGLEARDELGNPLGTINVASSVLDVGAAYRFNAAFSMGLGIKYFQDKLADVSASGVGFDLGMLLKTSVRGLSFGLSAQNLGAKVTYDQEKQPIPFTIRGGVAYQFFNPDLNLMLDVVKASDSDVSVHFGVEYAIVEEFSLRLGNRFAADNMFTPAFGAGFHLQQQYHLYYTFATYTDLGSVHRIGISFLFSPPKKKVTIKPLYDATKPVELIPPADLTVEVSGEELHIEWTRVAGVQYNVYARHSSKTEWIKLNKSPLYNNTMKFKKPEAPGIFYFRVSSVYENKESAYSKEVNLNVE